MFSFDLGLSINFRGIPGVAAPEVAPSVVTPLSQQRVQQNTGVASRDVRPNFANASTYELVSPVQGVTINNGILSIDTDAITNSSVVVRARNDLGFVDSTMTLKRAPQLGIAIPDNQLRDLSNAALDAKIARLKSLGVSRIRFDYRWQDTLDPANLVNHKNNRIINVCHTYGIRPVLVWTSHNGWDNAEWQAWLPQANEYAQAVTRHFASLDVHDHELGNEPNLPSFMDPDVTVATFTQWHLNTYAGIKAAHPNAFVIAAGISPVGGDTQAVLPGGFRSGWPFYEAMYENGLRSGTAGSYIYNYDAIASHPYAWPFPLKPDESWKGWTVGVYYLREVQTIDWGDTTKPLWLTEFGGPSKPVKSDNFYSDADQLSAYQEAFTLLESQPLIPTLFAYTDEDFRNLSEIGQPGVSTEDYFGLWRKDGTEKPVVAWLKTVLRGERGIAPTPYEPTEDLEATESGFRVGSDPSEQYYLEPTSEGFVIRSY